MTRTSFPKELFDGISFEVTLHDCDVTCTDEEVTVEMDTEDTLTADELYVDPTPLSWMSKEDSVFSGSRRRDR